MENNPPLGDDSTPSSETFSTPWGRHPYQYVHPSTDRKTHIGTLVGPLHHNRGRFEVILGGLLGDRKSCAKNSNNSSGSTVEDGSTSNRRESRAESQRTHRLEEGAHACLVNRFNKGPSITSWEREEDFEFKRNICRRRGKSTDIFARLQKWNRWSVVSKLGYHYNRNEVNVTYGSPLERIRNGHIEESLREFWTPRA